MLIYILIELGFGERMAKRMRPIDADALGERLKDLGDWCRDLRRHGIEQARSMVHEAPTIDAVPVVRCRDCVHSEIHRVRDGLFSETDVRKCEMCAFLSTVVDDDDFCSLGQRKEA